jgi:hypothetical protein
MAAASGFGAPRDLGLRLYDVDHTSLFFLARDSGALNTSKPRRAPRHRTATCEPYFCLS